MLYALGGPPKDGALASGIFVNPQGKIFGTTIQGGSADDGTIFELLRSGSAYSDRLVHSFVNSTDGSDPMDGVVGDALGRLYATTFVGGAQDGGTVAQFTPSGERYEETELTSFAGITGSSPAGGLLHDKSPFYATTYYGGAHGYGSILKISQSGLNVTDLYDFTLGNDGGTPASTLIADSQGALYGTTRNGGATNGGVVFKFVPSGSRGTETVLWTFQGGGGVDPYPGVIRDDAGNLYGVTFGGGRYNDGVVYKLSLAGGKYKETVLHAFQGAADGGTPFGLVRSGDELYGTAEVGGTGPCTNGCGTLFRISTTGTGFTVLHTFIGSDGALPFGNLVLHDQSIYGVTYEGSGYGDGMYGYGTVFRFTP